MLFTISITSKYLEPCLATHILSTKDKALDYKQDVIEQFEDLPIVKGFTQTKTDKTTGITTMIDTRDKSTVAIIAFEEHQDI